MRVKVRTKHLLEAGCCSEGTECQVGTITLDGKREVGCDVLFSPVHLPCGCSRGPWGFQVAAVIRNRFVQQLTRKGGGSFLKGWRRGLETIEIGSACCSCFGEAG